MPTYNFECDTCGQQAEKVMTFEEHDTTRRIMLGHFPDTDHPFAACVMAPTAIFHISKACGRFVQVYDFSFKRAMPDHYNHTVDQYVRNESDFTSALHRQSDEMSARMGFDTNFEVVDGHDKEALGVTDDGLEATERRLVNTGQVAPKLYL